MKNEVLDLVGLLRVVADMEPFLMADHSDEEMRALREAAGIFELPYDEVFMLARVFFDADVVPRENWVSELATDRVFSRLIHYGYFEKEGRIRLTEAARKAIMAGDPYIVPSEGEDELFFRDLAIKVDGPFDDENSTMPYRVFDMVDEHVRVTFARRFRKRYGDLPDDDKDLLLVLCSQFQTRGPQGWTIPGTVSAMERKEALRVLGRLMEHGLVLAVAPEGELDSKKHRETPVLLAPSVAGYLFEGLGRHVNFGVAMSCFGSFIGADAIKERTLYYDGDAAPEVDRLFRAFSQERCRRLMDILATHGGRRCITCLLYGPPGTGKTELALQLARSSARSVLKADVAKLTGSYVGESERGYRGLFLVYRYAALILDPAPVLLLNEADVFMSSRVHARRSNDKYENNIQAILIEEMEAFEGLLVATTNNPGSFDEAYDRRFLLKMEIGLPDEPTRLRIWRDRMPELPADVAERLATRYRLTGAGIETVVARFALLEALDDRKPGYADLADLCSMVERKVVGRSRSPVGYNFGN